LNNSNTTELVEAKGNPQPAGKGKKRRLPLRRSVVTKFFFSMVGCVLISILLNWLLNNLVLENYYRNRKIDNLKDTFSQVDTIFQSSSQQDIRLEMERLGGRTNYSMMIVDRKFQVVDFAAGNYVPDEWTSRLFYVQIATQLSPGQCTVSVSNNPRLGQEYLLLTGILHNNYIVVLCMPLQAIRENVDISNRFLLFSGIFSILISALLAFWLARGFTKPIKELAGITNSLAQFDFTKRYNGRGSDEIAELGQSINTLSSELEKNISELKTLNAQLERDNEIKTRQDQLRRDFIANASHELKTPIALIRAYAEGVSDEVSTDEQSRRYYCEVIQDEADKMSALIKKMTSLMQLESGEEELTFARFEITGLISGVLRRYSILLDQKKITVSFLPEGEIFCWGDEYFMENVINNYVSNASNHVSEKGEIVVEEHVVTTPEGQKRVHVSVFNTGNPIAQEDLTRIWESFYKVDKARTRQYGGTGLGLSVVAAIMHAHNMPCGVENCEGGVRFWFELELA